MRTKAQVCTKCGQPNEFGWRNKSKGIRLKICKLCMREYGKAHYAANPQAYIDKASAWNVKTRKVVYDEWLAYMLEHPCVDCGEADPVVLTFDHVRGSKCGNISKMMSDCTWSTILVEIQKCDDRCANCHMRRTAKQLGWRRSGDTYAG